MFGTFSKFTSQKQCNDWVFSVLRTVQSDYTVQCEQLAEFAKSVYNAGDLESANAFCNDLRLYLLAAFIMPYRVSSAQAIQRAWRGFAVRMVHPLYVMNSAIYKPRAEKLRLEMRIFNMQVR